MSTLIKRTEHKHDRIIDEVYEVNGLSILISQELAGSKHVILCVDLDRSGHVLSAAGHHAIEDLIEEYAQRGVGYRRLANNDTVRTKGDSIVVLCYRVDVPELTKRLLDIVEGAANLDKRL